MKMNKCQTIDEVITESIRQIESGRVLNWCYRGKLCDETIAEIPELVKIHKHGIITTDSQANYRDAKPRKVSCGFVNDDGKYTPEFSNSKARHDQRAYLCMLVPNSKVQLVKDIMHDKIVFTPDSPEQEYNVTRAIYSVTKKRIPKERYYETTWVGTNRFGDMPEGYFTLDLEQKFRDNFTQMTVLEPEFGLQGSLIHILATNLFFDWINIISFRPRGFTPYTPLVDENFV